MPNSFRSAAAALTALATLTALSGISACASSAPPAGAPRVAAPPPAPEPNPPPPPTFEVPQPLPVSGWAVWGPFDNPVAEDQGRQGMAQDLLQPLGGEAKAQLGPNTSLTIAGKKFEAREATPDKHSVIDLAKLYGQDTDLKVAYAYTELDVPTAGQGYAYFGSDDAAAVWVNGREVHRIIRDRAIDPNSDQFEVPLAAGKNRVLVKVDNGGGGWAFALRLFDAEGKRQVEAFEARRHIDWLDPGAIDDGYLLGSSFPEITWRNPEQAPGVFGDHPLRVRWFDPNLNEVEAPRTEGRYIALLEAETLDGYPYQHMLTFAKVPGDATLWFPTPPQRGIPADAELPPNVAVALNPAQVRELKRHIWAAAGDLAWRSERSAVLALALHDLKDSTRAAGEPNGLDNGYIQMEKAQLALRLKLEGRQTVPLKPPQKLATPAPVLKPGSEYQAGMKPGTVARLRKVAKEWAEIDPSEFVVLVARRGVIFMHEGFNGFDKDSFFYPASIGKTVAALTFLRAVDQGLLGIDQRVGEVLPEWNAEHTRDVTFRHCFNHITGLSGHGDHGGLFNPYLDTDLFVQDGLFVEPGKSFLYGGNAMNLVGKAIELRTGQSIFEILREQLQVPFGEPVRQFDLGFGDHFNALYLAKLGQMLIQDGAYGEYRFYAPGRVNELWPKRVADFAPEFDDPKLESGLGLGWMIDPKGPREQGALGPDVVGHGAASGVTYRIAREKELVIVVGRNEFHDWQQNETWGSKFVVAVAENIRD